jgi:hypothetical protein
MVELAWGWLRFQPSNRLCHWFNQRLPAPENDRGASVS